LGRKTKSTFEDDSSIRVNSIDFKGNISLSKTATPLSGTADSETRIADCGIPIEGIYLETYSLNFVEK